MVPSVICIPTIHFDNEDDSTEELEIDDLLDSQIASDSFHTRRTTGSQSRWEGSAGCLSIGLPAVPQRAQSSPQDCSATIAEEVRILVGSVDTSKATSSTAKFGTDRTDSRGGQILADDHLPTRITSVHCPQTDQMEEASLEAAMPGQSPRLLSRASPRIPGRPSPSSTALAA